MAVAALADLADTHLCRHYRGIGFGPGDDGFTGAFWLYLLANFGFMWAYGVHLRATSPYW